MKTLILSDLHIGRKNFDPVIIQEVVSFLQWTMELCAAENINTIVLNGDTFDNKKVITTEAYEVFENFKTNCYKKDIHLIVNLGNHDIKNPKDYTNTFFKTFEQTFTVITEPETMVLNGVKYGFVPYTFKHNREAFEAAMSGWDCERAFTHNYFETNGKNDVDVPCKVYNGHIHSGNFETNDQSMINLGTGYQMDWSDADQDKYVHILDANGVKPIKYERSLFKRLRVINGKLYDENPLVWLMKNKKTLARQYIYVYIEGSIDKVSYEKMCAILNSVDCHEIKFSEHIQYAVDAGDVGTTNVLEAIKQHAPWTDSQMKLIDSLYEESRNG